MLRPLLFRWFCSLLCWGLLLACAFQSSLRGAPTPRPRPPLPLEPGEYTLTWGVTTYHLGLATDGYLSCVMGECVWEGSWAWDARSRLLIVCEGPRGQPPAFRWSVVLDRDLAGSTREQKVAVRLVRVK